MNNELRNFRTKKNFLQQMMPDCEDVFLKEPQCWWRNAYYPCCEIFAKHKTEFGICYGFNSLLNNEGKRLDILDDFYPRRSSDFGEWTGLRFFVNLTTAFNVPNSTTPPGYLITLHDPEVWPSVGFSVHAGTATNCLIKPLYTYTTSGMASLAPKDRQCIYEHEITDFGGTTLPGLKYIKLNCISECRQQYMIDRCGCTVEFMFPIGNFTPCNVTGLICLNKLISKINYF